MYLIIKGESPNFLISQFDLGYENEAKFLNFFALAGEKIVFPYFASNFRSEEGIWKNFIENRTIFKTQSWSFAGVLHQDVYWYSPKNVEELIKVIKNDPFTYVCFVLPENHNCNINTYKYFIHVVEHLQDEENKNDEFRGIFIEESHKDSFQQIVLTKLKKHFDIKASLLN